MALEENTSDLPETEQAGKGLDSIIDKAIEAAEAPQDEQPSSSEPKSDKTGRLHGQDGKFIAKTQNSDDGAASPEGATNPESTPKPDAAAEPAKAQQFEPHPRWTEAQKTFFATLTPEGKKFALDVQAEHEGNFTRKAQEYSEYRKSADPLLEAVKPFQTYLTQLAPVVGQQPHEMLRTLLATEHNLRTGSPEQKYTQFAQLANAYGIDLAALAGGHLPQVDPASTQQRQQINALEQRIAQFEQLAQQQQNEQAQTHIDTFASAKDDAGRPRYPHFERVRAVMAHYLANGEAKSMEEAYQKATAPIQEAIAAELKARQEQVDTQRKEAVAKAQKAAPVRSSGSQPGGSTKGKGLDAILDEAISARM